MHLAELTQSLAILAGAGDSQLHHTLRTRLMAVGQWVGSRRHLASRSTSLSVLIVSSVYFVRDRINRDWSKMLFAGATSFWETLSGGWDFNHAGSLCHGWSGTPIFTSVWPGDQAAQPWLCDNFDKAGASNDEAERSRADPVWRHSRSADGVLEGCCSTGAGSTRWCHNDRRDLTRASSDCQLTEHNPSSALLAALNPGDDDLH